MSEVDHTKTKGRAWYSLSWGIPGVMFAAVRAAHRAWWEAVAFVAVAVLAVALVHFAGITGRAQ